MTTDRPDKMLTVQEIAADMHIKDKMVLHFIHSGQLDAINAAKNPSGRALWRIDPGAYQRFLAARSSAARCTDDDPATPPRRRPRTRKPRRQYV